MSVKLANSHEPVCHGATFTRWASMFFFGLWRLDLRRQRLEEPPGQLLALHLLLLGRRVRPLRVDRDQVVEWVDARGTTKSL